MKKILYWLIQCIWGSLATLVGFFFFLANIKHEHKWYRCAIDTKWNHWGGLSLGLFIFTPKDDVSNAQEIRVHEYGHTIQNLVMGPFMFFLGLISVAWGDLPCFKEKRAKRYTACFVEAWASRWGELVTGEKAIW